MVKYRNRRRRFNRMSQEQYNKMIILKKKQAKMIQERGKIWKQEEAKRTKKRVRELYLQYLAWLKLNNKYTPDCECGNGGIASGW